MKLDLTSLFFNGNTVTPGNTPSWGTSLGQERPDYPISVEGAEEIFRLITNPNHNFNFDPFTNPNHRINIRNIAGKKVLCAGRFDVVFVIDQPVEALFFDYC